MENWSQNRARMCNLSQGYLVYIDGIIYGKEAELFPTLNGEVSCQPYMSLREEKTYAW